MDLSNLRHFRKASNILLFFEVFFSLLTLRLLVRFVSVRRMLAMIGPVERQTMDPGRIELIVLFSNILLHRIFRTPRPCMLRSLLLLKHARRMGLDARIVFGVREAGANGLEGHAWVIHQGEPFYEPSDTGEGYKVMAVYP